MDREIIEKLKKICFFKYKIVEDKCISLQFTDELNPFFGTIRHNKDKRQIIGLVDELKNLEYLDLRKNKIIEDFTLNLPNLKHLDLGSNYLGKVPRWIKDLNLNFLNKFITKLN